jgi:hypothetical protein
MNCVSIMVYRSLSSPTSPSDATARTDLGEQEDVARQGVEGVDISDELRQYLSEYATDLESTTKPQCQPFKKSPVPAHVN